jgi:hypothetical protein
MSNHLAIATVTSTLKHVLDTEMKLDFTDISVTVSTISPDDNFFKNDPPALNIFLYRTLPSPAWKNIDLPGRREDGSPATKPQIGLDLFYLLTAYGKSDDNDPKSHRIMGSAVRTLHEKPVLTRKTITSMINSLQDATHPLKKSDLAAQVELVKFTPVSLNLEELSKLWSVFFQTPYRLSVVYQAAVVLIDGKTVPSSALPVQERKVFVLPILRPLIESVSPQFASMSDPLIIQGNNLKSKSVIVDFGAVSVAPAQDKIQGKQIEVTLPAGLRAGVNTVKVVHTLDINGLTGPHKAFESNTAAFVLRPELKAAPTTSGVTGTAKKKGKITLKFKPDVGKLQNVVLLLNQLNPPPDKAPLAYQFESPPDNGITDPNIAETDTIKFVFSDVSAGKYLVRARVDGAETKLETDPATGEYDSPKVTI